MPRLGRRIAMGSTATGSGRLRQTSMRNLCKLWSNRRPNAKFVGSRSQQHHRSGSGGSRDRTEPGSMFSRAPWANARKTSRS